jgi:hypothetical protein
VYGAISFPSRIEDAPDLKDFEFYTGEFAKIIHDNIVIDIYPFSLKLYDIAQPTILKFPTKTRSLSQMCFPQISTH